MQDILLAGNAITARILFSYLQGDARYRIVGCVVDDPYVASAEVDAVHGVGFSNVLKEFPPDKVRVLLAMGYQQVNGVRRSMFERLKAAGYAFETYVHPAAHVFSAMPLGEGCIILPGALVEPGAALGRGCAVWGNVVVAHDARVGDFCWLAAGAVVSGMASVGEGSFVGVNAVIANKVTVGKGNIVGGAAFISKNTKDNAVYLARSGEPFRCTAEEYDKFFGL